MSDDILFPIPDLEEERRQTKDWGRRFLALIIIAFILFSLIISGIIFLHLGRPDCIEVGVNISEEIDDALLADIDETGNLYVMLLFYEQNDIVVLSLRKYAINGSMTEIIQIRGVSANVKMYHIYIVGEDQILLLGGRIDPDQFVPQVQNNRIIDPQQDQDNNDFALYIANSSIVWLTYEFTLDRGFTYHNNQLLVAEQIAGNTRLTSLYLNGSINWVSSEIGIVNRIITQPDGFITTSIHFGFTDSRYASGISSYHDNGTRQWSVYLKDDEEVLIDGIWYFQKEIITVGRSDNEFSFNSSQFVEPGIGGYVLRLDLKGNLSSIHHSLGEYDDLLDGELYNSHDGTPLLGLLTSQGESDTTFRVLDFDGNILIDEPINSTGSLLQVGREMIIVTSDPSNLLTFDGSDLYQNGTLNRADKLILAMTNGDRSWIITRTSDVLIENRSAGDNSYDLKIFQLSSKMIVEDSFRFGSKPGEYTVEVCME